MTALNPVFKVGDQVAEALVVHGRMDWRAARAEAVRLMDAVRIPDAAARARDYPHQLSGGQRQRVLIAMALACKPALDHRRRADNGARRHHPGADSRPAAPAASRARTRAAAHHPRPRRGRRDGRPRRRDVRRPHRRAGPGRRDLCEPAASLHERAARVVAGVQGAGSEAGGRSGKRLQAIEGTVPTLANLPPGCAFEPRCGERIEVCREAVPALVALGDDRAARCVHVHTEPSAGSAQ